MKFESVLSSLVRNFGEHDISYGLTGGFALGLWGAPRTTVDLDFLIAAGHRQKVVRIMEELDYECLHQSENVSQFASRLGAFGSVDYIHAHSRVALAMLERAVTRQIAGKELAIRVLCPEDIIGLKLQAFHNDPSRKRRELTDIEALLEAEEAELDWELLQDYFGVFGEEQLLAELRKEYGEAQ